MEDSLLDVVCRLAVIPSLSDKKSSWNHDHVELGALKGEGRSVIGRPGACHVLSATKRAGPSFALLSYSIHQSWLGMYAGQVGLTCKEL